VEGSSPLPDKEGEERGPRIDRRIPDPFRKCPKLSTRPFLHPAMPTELASPVGQSCMVLPPRCRTKSSSSAIKQYEHVEQTFCSTVILRLTPTTGQQEMAPGKFSRQTHTTHNFPAVYISPVIRLDQACTLQTAFSRRLHFLETCTEPGLHFIFRRRRQFIGHSPCAAPSVACISTNPPLSPFAPLSLSLSLFCGSHQVEKNNVHAHRTNSPPLS
jgi:hypothetical protein